MYVAQAIPPIDAEISEKGHLCTETNYLVYRVVISCWPLTTVTFKTRW